MWKVYILKSRKKRWYYVGSTNRLPERLCEHNKGRVVSTKHYLPFDIVYTKDYELEKEARAFERLLKDKRIEKERIIDEIERK